MRLVRKVAATVAVTGAVIVGFAGVTGATWFDTETFHLSVPTGQVGLTVTVQGGEPVAGVPSGDHELTAVAPTLPGMMGDLVTAEGGTVITTVTVDGRSDGSRSGVYDFSATTTTGLFDEVDATVWPDSGGGCGSTVPDGAVTGPLSDVTLTGVPLVTGGVDGVSNASGTVCVALTFPDPHTPYVNVATVTAEGAGMTVTGDDSWEATVIPSDSDVAAASAAFTVTFTTDRAGAPGL